MLVYFIYKMIFDNKINCEYYCNNYIYNYTEIGQILDFEEYNVSVKLGIIYVHIIKYFNLLLFNERHKLLITNLIRGL